MTNSSLAAADPGCDPVVVLGMVVESLTATEASIARLQAVKEGFLAVAARVASEIAAGTDAAGLPGPVRAMSAELAERSVAAEIGAALRVSDRTVQRRMGLAAELMGRFPAVLEALTEARISLPHARMIQEAGARIEGDAARDRFVARVLPVAEAESPNRARRVIEREAERACPRSLTERHREAQAGRRVWREDLPDGQKLLGLIHSATVIDGVYDRLSQQARMVQVANAQATREASAAGPASAEHLPAESLLPESLPAESLLPESLPAESLLPESLPAESLPAESLPAESLPAESLPAGSLGHPDDVRTMDQLRADLAADVLLTGDPAGHDSPEGLLAAVHARVEVTVPVLTLLRATRPAAGTGATGTGAPFVTAASSESSGDTVDIEAPGELAWGSPVDTDTARMLAAGVPGWERVLTHPVTGAVLAVDRYRPNTDLRRLLHARDSRCRFPGCGLPPAAQDLDHTIDAAFGGRTGHDNLGGFCRRHHLLKHHGRWRVTQAGAGLLRWTSPTGRSYTDSPPSPVTFTISDTDPPPRPEHTPAPF